MDLQEAEKVANYYIEEFKPYCKKIEIAGSIRRQLLNVKDVEIICVPDTYKLEQYFLQNKQKYQFIKNGGKYKQFYSYRGEKVDLFITVMDQWAITKLIRTGSAFYSKRFMQFLISKGYECSGNVVRSTRTGSSVKFKEEKDIFKYFGLPYVEPPGREL